MPSPLRRRIEQSPLLIGAVGRIVAAWTRFCRATTRWEWEGTEELAAAVAEGPVIVVLWHEMVMMGGAHWNAEWGPLSILHDVSPAARIAGVAQARFGARPFPMSSKVSNLAISRDVLALLKSGVSLGITGDGPRGPRREMKDAPLEWARAAGVPVFVYGYAMSGQRRAGSWDRLVIPMPFGRGSIRFARWAREVPRRADAETRAALKSDLAAFLTATSDAAEAAVRGPRA